MNAENAKVLATVATIIETLLPADREDLRERGTASTVYAELVAGGDPFWADALVQYVQDTYI